MPFVFNCKFYRGLFFLSFDSSSDLTGRRHDFIYRNWIFPFPSLTVVEWVTISEEHNIYVVDVGLSTAQCDYLVSTTEQACRGQYAAYTYAKQTLGCRDFPILAHASFLPVHTVVHAITKKFSTEKTQGNLTAARTTKIAAGSDYGKTINVDSNQINRLKVRENDVCTKNNTNVVETTNSHVSSSSSTKPHRRLQLDDREPHVVKYDVTKKERQKLDMHTDKSEWTFLIALSNGCGVDYEGGGTYFECLDATVHIQRGHALVFPGKLRHCGQKITSGLRFLLVGFLVDKAQPSPLSGDGGGCAISAGGAVATPSPAAGALQSSTSC
jgi:hypothetical protein